MIMLGYKDYVQCERNIFSTLKWTYIVQIYDLHSTYLYIVRTKFEEFKNCAGNLGGLQISPPPSFRPTHSSIYMPLIKKRVSRDKSKSFAKYMHRSCAELGEK